MRFMLPRSLREAAQSMMLSFFTCWVCAVAITRLYAFHSSYMKHLTKIEDEAWLRNKCRDPDFFSNLRQHTELCTEIFENFKRSPVLVALNEIASTTHLCGSQSCFSLVQDISRGGLPLLGCLVLFFVFTPSFIIPFVRMGIDNTMERRMLRACSAMYDRSTKPRWAHSWAYLSGARGRGFDGGGGAYHLEDTYVDPIQLSSPSQFKKLV